MRILIVEDDSGAAEALTALAESRNHEVRCAHDGATAIAIAAGTAFIPDIALIDFRLPDLDGFEVATRLEQMCPDTTLVLLSGLPAESPILPPFHYRLRKPPDIAALLAILDGEVPPSDRDD
jgi:DNA-binding response OmpR family regulator